jgi:LuxR family transcriptional regulator, maltose regulon positive regulatory protein
MDNSAPMGHACSRGGLTRVIPNRVTATRRSGSAVSSSPTKGQQATAARRGNVLSGTKVRAPRVHPESLRRPRLTSRLVDPEVELVVVVGPAGYGKTTLLADWADRDPRAFGWVHLDERDNDLARLAPYLLAALRQGREADPGDTALLDRDPVGALVTAAEAATAEVVVVLDDYHHITDPTVHDAVFALVERSPANVTVAIASRADVPLPIARFRASGALVEIRMPELRFTVDESRDLLDGTLGADLGLADIATLHARTDGWPAALYLAYLSYRDASDPHAFVASFGAANRHIGDYLTEQVLAVVDQPTLQFMLETSIVDQVNGPLADFLTETDDSGARLVALERANRFIVPLDDRREWYRYHPLLAELLAIELRRTAPETIPELHRRASRWFESVTDMDPAVRHAIKADDRERAANLISAAYLDRLEAGRMATIAEWLDLMGVDAVRSDGRLAIARAWTMQFLGRRADAEQALDDARMAADQGQPPEGTASFESSAELLAAAFPGGDVGRMLRAALRAFELESERDTPWRATVHVLLGFALVRAGRFAEARSYLETGDRLAADNSAWMDVVGARSLRARIARHEGQLVIAERLARSAVETSEAHGLAASATGAYAALELGSILVRAGRHLEGHAMLVEALVPLRRLGEPLAVVEGLLPIAEALRQLGRRREARQALEEADALLASMSDPGYLRIARESIVSLVGLPRSVEDRELSRRELEVLRLMATGRSKREVANELVVSYNTIHSHYRSIYRKLEVGSKADALDRAVVLGVIDPADAPTFSSD